MPRDKARDDWMDDVLNSLVTGPREQLKRVVSTLQTPEQVARFRNALFHRLQDSRWNGEFEGARVTLNDVMRIVGQLSNPVSRSHVIELTALRLKHVLAGLIAPSSRRWSARRTDRLLFAIRLAIPRKHRDAIMGDILEDVLELRANRVRERRVFGMVLWQLLIIIISRVFALFGLVAKIKAFVAGLPFIR